MVGREPGYPTNNGERGEVIATLSQEETIILATLSLIRRHVEEDQKRIGYDPEEHRQDIQQLNRFSAVKLNGTLDNPTPDMKLICALCDLDIATLPEQLDKKIEAISKKVLRHEIDYGILSILKELEGGSSTTYVIAQAYDNLNPEEKPLNPAKPNRYISSRDPIGQQFRRTEMAFLNEEQRQNLTTQSLNEAKEKLIGITKQRLDELGVSSYVSVVAHKDSKNPYYEYVTLFATKGGVVAEALNDPVAVLRERARADFERFTAAYNYKKHEKAQKTYEELEKKFPKTEDDRDKLYESSTTVLEMVIDNSIKDELERLLATLEHVSSLDSITPDSPEYLYKHRPVAKLSTLDNKVVSKITTMFHCVYDDETTMFALTGTERPSVAPSEAIYKIVSMVNDRLAELGIDYLHTVVQANPEVDEEIIIYLSCAQNSA